MQPAHQHQLTRALGSCWPSAPWLRALCPRRTWRYPGSARRCSAALAPPARRPHARRSARVRHKQGRRLHGSSSCPRPLLCLWRHVLPAILQLRARSSPRAIPQFKEAPVGAQQSAVGPLNQQFNRPPAARCWRRHRVLLQPGVPDGHERQQPVHCARQALLHRCRRVPVRGRRVHGQRRAGADRWVAGAGGGVQGRGQVVRWRRYFTKHAQGAKQAPARRQLVAVAGPCPRPGAMPARLCRPQPPLPRRPLQASSWPPSSSPRPPPCGSGCSWTASLRPTGSPTSTTTSRSAHPTRATAWHRWAGAPGSLARVSGLGGVEAGGGAARRVGSLWEAWRGRVPLWSGRCCGCGKGGALQGCNCGNGGWCVLPPQGWQAAPAAPPCFGDASGEVGLFTRPRLPFPHRLSAGRCPEAAPGAGDPRPEQRAPFPQPHGLHGQRRPEAGRAEVGGRQAAAGCGGGRHGGEHGHRHQGGAR
jgi:hypothetical protein